MTTCSLHYLSRNPQSVEQANESASSFRSYGWEVQYVDGYTPETYENHPTHYRIMEGGRLSGFVDKKRETKLACVMNHVRFWERGG